MASLQPMIDILRATTEPPEPEPPITQGEILLGGLVWLAFAHALMGRRRSQIYRDHRNWTGDPHAPPDETWPDW